MNRPVPSARSADPATRPAFTLIELLVVIVIIGVVISILVPAIGGARDVARATGTKGMLENILQASTQFQNDHRRLPGYFTARDMGNSANLDHGMSAMENILLDLMGGVTDENSANPSQGLIEVGPANETVIVQVDLIGSQAGKAKSYLSLSAKNLAPQAKDQGKQHGDRGHTDDSGEPQLPDVVDEFGTPVLAWVADESAMGRVRTAENFAREDSSDRARFYWASNAAFLGDNATSVGKRNVNQSTDSLLGKNAIGNKHAETLMAFLGNPAYPQRDDPDDVPELAAAPRGNLILHSAGADGVYLGSKDRGANQFPTGQVGYWRNFAGEKGDKNTIFKDEQGNPRPDDVLKLFDDQVVSGGS